jgi:hypothetical protein
MNRFDNELVLGKTKEQFKQIALEFKPSMTDEEFEELWYDCFINHPKNIV